MVGFGRRVGNEGWVVKCLFFYMYFFVFNNDLGGMIGEGGRGGGGGQTMWIRFFLYVLGLFEGSFGLFLCIFGSIWHISTKNKRRKN